ncbi:Oidioi.mRNA.OKI2018_I69.chr2.g7471.t1.cds [Oikopleura dioica]|uniref:Enoyl-CoA hydratase domain-containing protein 3, mitochondrial n=1 Tax=Oikopleura dioica TaxID=34765 RepID=A0ABN7TCX1_OIKDI|nr:Oidioi.mRNA.OKI2018_I69.chr2.g7471.t1.cds [Oikopleura dioica]
MKKIRGVDVPVISQVTGLAVAAGAQLAIAADITIASENAKFSVPGAKTIGLYCHSPAVELARAVPRKIAMDLLVTGDFLEASDAYRAGMISRLVGDYDACVAAVEDVINKIENTSRSVQALGKQKFYDQVDLPIQGAADLMENAMYENLQLADTQIGINSFMEKKKPQWTHSNAKRDP